MLVRRALPILVIVTACAGAPAPAPTALAPPTAGSYLGQPTPGAEPALFAPGLISTGLDERDTAWSPDGRELLYTTSGGGRGAIVRRVQLADGTWGDPELVPAIGGGPALEPFVTADGRWLYFASPRPLPGETTDGDWNIWRCPRAGADWGPPEALPDGVNGPGDEFYPSLERDGTLYITAARADSLGGEDLYRVPPAGDDGWLDPENLGPSVNSAGPEFNALVHPDGRWILFGSVRAGAVGGGDLFVSFRTGDGGWTAATALPQPVNSPALDFCPALSPDGRWLFFTSRRVPSERPAPASFAELRTQLTGPGNGLGDIWWVDAKIVDALRPMDAPEPRP